MLHFAESTTMGCLGLIFQATYVIIFITVVLFVAGVLWQLLGVVGLVLGLAFAFYLRK